MEVKCSLDTQSSSMPILFVSLVNFSSISHMDTDKAFVGEGGMHSTGALRILSLEVGCTAERFAIWGLQAQRNLGMSQCACALYCCCVMPFT